jgi:outer membrane protein TolC
MKKTNTHSLVPRSVFVLLALMAPAAASAQTPAPLPQTPPELPPSPSVEDPQLAPPPPAPRVLRSWDEALGLVRSRSPDYLSTYDAVLRAEAQSRVALAAVLPTLAGQGTFTHQFLTTQASLGGPPVTIPLQDVFGASATLTWNVGNPRGWYGVETARQREEAARVDLAEKRRTIAQAIVGAMLATLAAERVAELNRVGLRAALERLSLAQTKARLGSGTALDIDRAQQDVAAARALVITGDESLRQTRESLGLALGSSVAIAAPPDLGDLERAVATTCRMDDDIEHRPDVVAARERVKLADRAIEDAWLQLAPSLGVVSQLAWSSQVLYGPVTTWAVQGVLSVPLYDGGARYGYVRDAQAAADQAQQALIQARLGALVGVAQSVRAVDVTRASRDVAQVQRDLAQRVDQRTREGYLHGLGTSLDLVTSAQALRQTEINLVLLQFQASQARVLAILSKADCVY